MQNLSVPCRRCGTAVEVIPDAINLANDYGVLCDDCLKVPYPLPYAVKPIKRLSNFCPPCFDDTDPSMLPCREKSDVALAWKFGARGLNLWGFRGTGKTRTVSLIIDRELKAGHSVAVFGVGGFRQECEARNYRRAGWLKSLSSVDLLFIDDFDKQNLTRCMEKDLFSVLSNRMGRRPVITTGNSSGNDIERSFALGGPMVDRIRRYCQSVYFGSNSASSPVPTRAANP